MRYSRERKRQNVKDEVPERCGGPWALPSLLLLASLMLVSCASKQVYIPMAERAALENQRIQESATDSKAALSGSGGEGREGRGGITDEDISGSAARSSDSVARMNGLIKDIYFDFDSYALRNEDVPLLRDLSAWLKANKGKNAAIEGHCDERGSIEYNMALGQKRAEAVREYLLTSGVEKGRLKTISFGKETPIDAGHTEEAWSKNRRAHIKIE